MSGAGGSETRWSGKDGLFGGYVVARLVDAAAASSTFRLVSHQTTFVSRVEVAPSEIELTPAHAGRSTQLTKLTLMQAGRARAHATAEFVAADAGAIHLRSIRPEPVPAAARDGGYGRLGFHDLIEIRATAPPVLADEGASWARLRQPPAEVGLSSQEAVLAAVLDVPTPGLFGLARPPVFVPTIDYTLHFAPGPPVDPCEWIYLTHATAWATPDHCVDEAQAWTAEGRLLAQVRQTRGVRWT